MRRSRSWWALTLVSLIGCTGVSGNGHVTRSVRKLPAFDQVELGGRFALALTQGTPQQVVVSTDSNIQPLVTTAVHDSVLSIDLRKNVKPDVEVEIQVPHLTRLAISGAATTQLHGIDGDALKINVSGAASVHADGKVNHLVVHGSGAVDVDALGLHAAAVDVDLSGAGSAKVHADETLAADISGAGSVSYAGKPKVTQHVSGLGSIKAL